MRSTRPPVRWAAPYAGATPVVPRPTASTDVTGQRGLGTRSHSASQTPLPATCDERTDQLRQVAPVGPDGYPDGHGD